jgi:O-antigen/teichoic acid export membrane protein
MTHRVPTKNSRRVRAPDAVVGKAASRALAWSFVNTALGRVGTLAVGIFLARLLGPAEFGAFAVASVALVALLSINELGVSLAIIRWPQDPRTIAPTVNTIAVSFSVLLAVVGYVAAPWFASAMGDEGATAVVRLMLVSVVLDGLASTPAALLQRQFKGGRRTAIDQVNLWLGSILSVVCALAGLGAMSLAIGRVVGSGVSTAIFIMSSPLPYRFGLDRTHARHLLRFGLPLALSSVLVFAIGYSDQLIAGSVLGTTVLGFYVLAFNLASWPVNMFSQPLRNVAPSAFARLQHDPPQMVGALRSTVGLLARLTVPICLIIAGAAVPIVLFVYGPEWAESAQVLPWLAVLAIFRIFFQLSYDFIIVLGRSFSVLVIQIAWVVVLIPGLFLGAKLWGLVGLAAVQVAIALLVVLPLYLIQFHRFGLSPSRLFSRVWLPLLIGVAVGAASLLVSTITAIPFVACSICGLIGLATVAVLLRRDRAELTSLQQMGTLTEELDPRAEGVVR